MTRAQVSDSTIPSQGPSSPGISSALSEWSAHPEQKLRVGLVGWFRRRNFGDDLMGVHVALRLRASGFEVCVLGMCRESASDFAIPTLDSVDELVERCDAIVYAGGGVFTNAHGAMEGEDGFGSDMVRLCAGVKRRKIHLALISVGGDGEETRASGLTAAQIALLETASLVTFRNEEDLNWADRWRIAPQVFPDMVWRSAMDLGVSSRPKSLILLHNQSTKRRVLARTGAAVARIRSGADNRAITYRCEFYEPDRMSVGEICFTSVRSAIQLAAEAKACFTNRLHLGMFVLSLGGRTFLTSPEPKARIVFERMGWTHLIVEPGLRSYGSAMLNGLNVLSSTDPRPAPSELAALASRADGHFVALGGWLRGVAATKLDESCADSAGAFGADC